MAQHDYNIANQGFPAFRTDLNNALSAIQTNNSGTSRPTGAVAGQLWLDTTTATSPTLKYYDGADDISLATIDHTANTVNWLDSTVSITGLTTTATGTVLTLSDSANTSTVNLIIDNDKEIRFREATANGTNYVSLSAPASLASDVAFTLPATDGTNGQALTTNGSGVLSFSSPSAGFSGATINAVGTSSITLTSASSQYQVAQINSTTNNFVTLPDATTLTTKGSPVFVIENSSPISNKIDIKNNAGTIIFTLSPNEVAFVSLKDNSTSAGSYSIISVAEKALFSNTSASYTTGSLTSNYRNSIIFLTSTKFVTVGIGGGTGTYILYTKVGDISGNTITFGSEQNTTSSANFSSNVLLKVHTFRLNDSAFVLFWGGCGNTSGADFSGFRNVSVCTVSGTTVTFGAKNNLSLPQTTTDDQIFKSTAGNGLACRMADDKFAVVYNTAISGANGASYNYSGSLTCNIITVSGTTLTVGTKVDLGSSTYTNPTTLVCHDTDRLCVIYTQNTSGSTTGRTKVNVISVSGTTPTWGTSVNVEASDIANCYPYSPVGFEYNYTVANYVPFSSNGSLGNCYGLALSTTKVFGAKGGGTGMVLISISGTTPSVVYEGVVKSTSYTNQIRPPVQINGTTALMFDDNNYIYVYFDLTNNLFSFSPNIITTSNSLIDEMPVNGNSGFTVAGSSASTTVLQYYTPPTTIYRVIKATLLP
jgi:hypothetical protein